MMLVEPLKPKKYNIIYLLHSDSYRNTSILALAICLIFSDIFTIEQCGRKGVIRPHDLEVLSLSTKVLRLLRHRRFQNS
jgi:hypothetical protein